jgi:hypothetical protein
MTDNPPGDRPRLVIGDLPPPRRRDPKQPPGKPKTPLFFFGRRDEMTLNWRHWAAPLVMLINIVTLPLALVIRLLEPILIEMSWRSRQAKQRRNQASDKS